MNSDKLVSLCIPTNGVVEWVFPVLDSIYQQNIDMRLFEVVVADDGDNLFFKEKMRAYAGTKSNIVYEETRAAQFINEIEAYRRAHGRLIKFVNHRTLLRAGTLGKLIKIAENYIETKPIIYFSNGVLSIEKTRHDYDSFDLFVKNLSYWSSWSTGMTIWKEDLDSLSLDVNSFNELFPHTDILFNERHRGRYIIDNSIIFDELPQGTTPKGNYDLFYAFGIEFPWIITSLLKDKSISNATFKSVKEDNLGFIAELYYDLCIKKKYSSYNLTSFKDIFDVYYNKIDFIRKLAILMFRKARGRLFKGSN